MEKLKEKLNKNDVKCEVCDSENVVEYPHLGFNCNDCNPIYI